MCHYTMTNIMCHSNTTEHLFSFTSVTASGPFRVFNMYFTVRKLQGSRNPSFSCSRRINSIHGHLGGFVRRICSCESQLFLPITTKNSLRVAVLLSHFVFHCFCSIINLQNRVYEHQQMIFFFFWEPNKLLCLLQIGGSWWTQARRRHCTIQECFQSHQE